MTVLEDAWQRLMDELAAAAPRTRSAVRPPTRTDGAQRLPVSLSAELRNWFELHDGCDPWDDGQILPFNVPLDVTRAVDTTLMIRRIWQTAVAADAHLTQREAGEVERTWLDQYVAIAEDRMGGCLFVDLREGPPRGFVRWWDKVDADDADVLAPGLADLLNTITHSLRTGESISGWAPEVVDGALDWQPAR